MLQMMQKKTSEEGEREQVLFDEFMCYCKTSQGTLSKAISDAETKIPQLQSSITEGTAAKGQLANEIAQATSNRKEAKDAVAEATAIRNKEHDAYTNEDAQSKAAVGAMKKALVALRKGASAAFLQTSSADILRQLAATADLSEWDRHIITAFVSTSEDDQDSEDEPESAEIIGIISQLNERFGKDIVAAAGVEKQNLDDFNSLSRARKKEVDILSKEILSKTNRIGALSVELVNLAQDLKDTTKLLEQDRKFLGDTQRGCKTKQSEWNVRSRTRADELLALGETLRILNNDQVATLFKRTMPTSSFMQIQVSSREVLNEARQALATPVGQPRDPRLNLISMNMRSRKVNYNRVTAMVDKMMVLLGKEQTNDDEKKNYCKQELSKSEDDKTTLGQTISDSRKTIANAQDTGKSLAEDIAKIAAGIRALNKEVAQATAMRKNENAAYTEELASNNAAIEILGIARNRMNKFYNPQLQLAQRKVRAAQAPKAIVGGGAGAVQEAFSFLQASSAKAAPKKAPPTWNPASSAKGKSAGVLKLIDTLVQDLKKTVTEMKQEEKDSQFEYEQFMKDSSEKHAADAKAISVKESAKAENEGEVQKQHKGLKMTIAEANANYEYLRGLHKQCDWLLKNHGVRQKARSAEIDSLRKAKAVLSGADSFLQVQAQVKHNLRRASHALTLE